MLWTWFIEVAAQRTSARPVRLLDGVDDSLVTLGHLTILFWLPGGRFAVHDSNVGATRSTGVNCSVANA